MKRWQDGQQVTRGPLAGKDNIDSGTRAPLVLYSGISTMVWVAAEGPSIFVMLLLPHLQTWQSKNSFARIVRKQYVQILRILCLEAKLRFSVRYDC